MSMRTVTMAVCAVDLAACVIIAFASLYPGSDAATRGLDQAAGVFVTALFLVTAIPGFALAWFRRAPVTGLMLALAFPAGFVVAFVAAVMAFAQAG